MRKIFLILFITFICLDLKAEKITKDNIKHVVTKKMYENDFDEFNFKVLETETNEIIKKQDLKKLTCDILFELKKSPIKALFIASKNGFLNWSRGERTIYCLGMTLLDFEMVDTNKEVNILYNDVNRNVENFLLEKTRYNLEKYYLGRNIIIYSIKNINFIVKKYPEEKAVEIEIEKFQQ